MYYPDCVIIKNIFQIKYEQTILSKIIFLLNKTQNSCNSKIDLISSVKVNVY